MNREEAILILSKIEYKDWSFLLGTNDDFWLQVSFYDHNGHLQKCRKWRLSHYMTRSEVVQTAFKAVLAAEEHEAREQFWYRDAAIFGPHFDVDVLAEMAYNEDNLDVREKL